MISRFGRPSCESIWRRRGDEEARITRFGRRTFSTGIESGGGRGSIFFDVVGGSGNVDSVAIVVVVVFCGVCS